MVASVSGQFLGILEIPVKDKAPMKFMQLLQQGKKGDFSIINIAIENGYALPKTNEKITLDVVISAFLSKKDNTAKQGLRVA